MAHERTMTITTQRLVLREFQEADWRALLEYQRDPRYLRYYHWNDRTPPDVRAFVHDFVVQQRERPRLKYQLAATLKSDARLIGNCGIRMRSREAHEADIGYELSPEHWGHGYATEAAAAVMDLGFRTLSLHRIWARCIAENTGSIRVLERLGMRLEGRLRENEYSRADGGTRWSTASLTTSGISTAGGSPARGPRIQSPPGSRAGTVGQRLTPANTSTWKFLRG